MNEYEHIDWNWQFVTVVMTDAETEWKIETVGIWAEYDREWRAWDCFWWWYMLFHISYGYKLLIHM